MDTKGDNDFAIEVALVDDSIIVTLPGTPFRTPTFRARAWTAGTDKARELGWLM